MTGLGMVPEPLREAAYLALQEGRLGWRCTDAKGRPSNGGSADPIPLGEWSPSEPSAELCRTGWHLTSDPLRWQGVRVFLCEGMGLAGRQDDKSCWTAIRPLGEVDPQLCMDVRVRVAAGRADLSGADLRGVDLSWAYLGGADLGAWERGPDGFARMTP